MEFSEMKIPLFLFPEFHLEAYATLYKLERHTNGNGILCTKIKFFIKYLVTYTKDILNGKLHFLCGDIREDIPSTLLILAYKYKEYS